MEAVAQPGLPYTVLWFAIAIGVLVTVHEFGHYIVGRFFGVKAEVFSIGFGPEIFGLNDRRGTRWKLCALPLGGYVKFAGDMNAASQPDPSAAVDLSEAERAQTFQAKALWQRALIVLAGPVTNFLFAVLLFAGLIMANGRLTEDAIVGEFPPGSGAEVAGLKPGDRILQLNGVAVERFADLRPIMAKNGERPVDVLVQRGEDRLRFEVAPKMIEEKDEAGATVRRPLLGITPAIVAAGPIGALADGVVVTKEVTLAIIDSLAKIFSGDASVKELGGPLKIAQISGQAAAHGTDTFVRFLAFVSINLGFINLLPVPVLDGGHLLLYAIEGVRRRALSPKVQELAFMSGFAALLTLMIVLTWNDLASFGVWKHLAGLVG